MKNFTLLAFGLCVLVTAVLITETEAAVAEEGGNPLQVLEELEKAKAKVGKLDAKLGSLAKELGPEGEQVYGLLKTQGKKLLKKGMSWLRSKFGGGSKSKDAKREDEPAAGEFDVVEDAEQ